MFKVRRALISVSDKRDLIQFAQGLADLGVEILSTGGTCRQLQEAGIDAIEVSSKTGFPEIMDGRVKTLHPVIHGGLLGRRGTDESVMNEHGIEPIDLLAVNLYPFEETISRPDATLDDAIDAAGMLAGLEEGDYGTFIIETELTPSEQVVVDFLSVASRSGIDISRWVRTPEFITRVLEGIDQSITGLLTFDDPKGMYTHCLCDFN